MQFKTAIPTPGNEIPFSSIASSYHLYHPKIISEFLLERHLPNISESIPDEGTGLQLSF